MSVAFVQIGGTFALSAPVQDAAVGGRLTLVRLSPGGIGVQSLEEDGLEVVQFGWPDESEFLHFMPLDDVTAAQNAVTARLRELFERREVRDIVFGDPAVWPCVRKAANALPVRWHYGVQELDPQEARPHWASLRQHADAPMRKLERLLP